MKICCQIPIKNYSKRLLLSIEFDPILKDELIKSLTDIYGKREIVSLKFNKLKYLLYLIKSIFSKKYTHDKFLKVICKNGFVVNNE